MVSKSTILKTSSVATLMLTGSAMASDWYMSGGVGQSWQSSDVTP